jgi:hypothetical protein
MTEALELAKRLREAAANHPLLRDLLTDAAEMLSSLDSDNEAMYYAMKEDRS